MRKKKEQKTQNAKKQMTFVLALMVFLFAYCYIMYTGLGNNNLLHTNVELKGGDDVISVRLQEIIPFIPKVDASIITAYQNRKILNTDIDNDVLLMKAYENSEIKTNVSFNTVLERLYGTNLFLVNKDFNPTGSLNCTYDSNTMKYTCSTQEYNDIIYDCVRYINKLNINENNYYLTEDVIFYSHEVSEDGILYKIYTDATYSEMVSSFTESNVNTDIEKYLMDKYQIYTNTYKSNFTVSKSTYRWFSTEKI